MSEFTKRIGELRKEIGVAIVACLKSKELSKLDFEETREQPTFVVWFDKDGNGYDSIVVRVSYDENEKISLEVTNDSITGTATVDFSDLGCLHLDWLDSLYEEITQTLNEE